MTTTESSVPPVTEYARVPLTIDLERLTETDSQLAALVSKLAHLDGSQLLQLAAYAGRLESCAFRLRGACVSELRRRITLRLPGGRGRRDAEGVGVKARLTRLATQIGISLSTLKTDARIHEVFFREETGLARDTSLAREFYVTALGAPDPLAAIKIAEERCGAAGYKREHFRRDVRQLKGMTAPATTTEITDTSLEPLRIDLSRLKLTGEAQHALHQLIERTGGTIDVLISEALVACYQALTNAKSDEAMNAPADDISARQTKKKRTASKEVTVSNRDSWQTNVRAAIAPLKFFSSIRKTYLYPWW